MHKLYCMKAGTGGFLFGFAAMVFSMPDMHQAESPLKDDRALAQGAQALPGMHLNSEGRQRN